MRRLSILIVDDAPDVGSLMSHQLRGHHNVWVHSEADAVDALNLLHFDVVIADLYTGSALGVVQTLKQHQPWVGILAICDGQRVDSGHDWARWPAEAGADGSLAKPFDETRLLFAVKACWEKASVRERPRAVDARYHASPDVAA
jgi:CheY-like chemotaxis protein